VLDHVAGVLAGLLLLDPAERLLGLRLLDDLGHDRREHGLDNRRLELDGLSLGLGLRGLLRNGLRRRQSGRRLRRGAG
jgi:hypothetical protein